MRLDMHDYTPAARRYWWTLMLTGFVVLVAMAWQLGRAPLSVVALAVVGAAGAAVVGLFPVHIPGTKTSIACADIFIVLMLLLVGVPGGVLASAVEGFVASARSSKRWTSRLLTPTQNATTMLVCGLALERMRAGLERWFSAPVALLAAVTLVCTLYYVLQLGGFQVVFALKKREPLRLLSSLRQNYLILLWDLASWAVAALIYLALQQFGWAALFVAIPVIALFFSTYRALDRAAEISRRKSEFLAHMSHELRTPLNAIIGGSEILKDGMLGPLAPRQAQWAQDIHESGKHLLTLINDILDISKIEAGQMELNRVPVDVGGAVASAMSLVKDAATRRHIELAAAVSPDAGAVAADERKLKQVLLNLLSNAIKFTPEGGRVRVIGRREPGAVEIAVEDTGIGIAPELHEAVFDAFRQVGNDAAGKLQGTGLGLTLARDLVRLHGGTLRLKSEPGRGSVFTMRLPDDGVKQAAKTGIES